MAWTISIVLIFAQYSCRSCCAAVKRGQKRIAAGDGAGDTEIVEDTQGGFGNWIKDNWQVIVQAVCGRLGRSSGIRHDRRSYADC